MSKAKIVLSDLHIGAGRRAEGNLLEDFTEDDVLVRLIRNLIAESDTDGTEIELVLDGDIFEFWQLPALKEGTPFVPGKRYPARCYLGTSEQESRRRIWLAIDGHQELFVTLADFLCPTAPRRTITLIKGNHDIQLYWPGVQEALREALDAQGERRDCLTFEQRAISREGVYIEHGSEYADLLNRHPNFDDPRHPRRPQRLRMVPGGPISIRLLTPLEREHYWIDGVKPFPAMLWYLLRFNRWLAVRMLFLLLPQAPRWLWVHRPFSLSKKELAREIREIEREMREEEGTGGAPCDAKQGYPEGLLNLPSLEEMSTDEEITEDPLLTRGLIEEHRLHARMVQVAHRKMREERACVVIFGHTHAPCVEVLEGNGVYINTGSWTWMLDLRQEPAETWRRLIRREQDFVSKRRLTYARIDYDGGGQPRAALYEYR